MLGIDLFDEIPCDVNAENISNCNKSRIHFRRCWQLSWNTKNTAFEIRHLMPKDCAPIFACMASVKSIKRGRKNRNR